MIVTEKYAGMIDFYKHSSRTLRYDSIEKGAINISKMSWHKMKNALKYIFK